MPPFCNAFNLGLEPRDECFGVALGLVTVVRACCEGPPQPDDRPFRSPNCLMDSRSCGLT